jgi:rod shape determining protein RodA
VGSVVVMLLVQLFLAALLQAYSKSRTRTYSAYALSSTYYMRERYSNPIKSTITNAIVLNTPMKIVAFSLGSTIVLMLFSGFVIPFNIVWGQVLVTLVILSNLIWMWLNDRIRSYLLIALFGAGSMLFSASTSFILNHVMEPHQRARINVLLGIDKDVTGAGYNVHQSVIAIGSGGLTGKGFLNGTQTKLHFVPEQDTDFIFCTVGEEEGFLGAIVVLSLFLALTLRLMYLADRQPFVFGRVYGYSVASIFLFHLFINVGMVLGITPVIGIPLPFFSYGGSSLWGFTILLFIFLRIDASRHLSHR